MVTKGFTEENIDHVLDNLWPRGRDEMQCLGISLEEARKNFKAMIGRPWNQAFYQEKDGECCALIYMEPIGFNAWRTHFIATEEGFKAIWFSLTKFLRRASDWIVNDMTAGKGLIELHTISVDDFDWFETLGFTLTETDGIIDKYLKKGSDHVWTGTG